MMFSCAVACIVSYEKNMPFTMKEHTFDLPQNKMENLSTKGNPCCFDNHIFVFHSQYLNFSS